MIDIKKGYTWDDSSFSVLGWSGSRLYSIIFPGEKNEYSLILLIDYIISHRVSNGVGFVVCTCETRFEQVSQLRINFDNDALSTIDLVNIWRKNERLSPNGKVVLYDYEVESYSGRIAFQAADFRQVALGDPTFSDESDLRLEGALKIHISNELS